MERIKPGQSPEPDFISGWRQESVGLSGVEAVEEYLWCSAIGRLLVDAIFFDQNLLFNKYSFLVLKYQKICWGWGIRAPTLCRWPIGSTSLCPLFDSAAQAV